MVENGEFTGWKGEGEGNPSFIVWAVLIIGFLCVWECAWVGEGGREMNSKHSCPPLQSHLLLNRFGGEQGLFCTHICTSLSL